MYTNLKLAELEIMECRRDLPEFTWTLAQWDDQNGNRVYEPIRICNLCGERLGGPIKHRC